MWRRESRLIILALDESNGLMVGRGGLAEVGRFQGLLALSVESSGLGDKSQRMFGGEVVGKAHDGIYGLIKDLDTIVDDGYVDCHGMHQRSQGSQEEYALHLLSCD